MGAKRIALYEPPYDTDGNRPHPFEDARNRLQSLISVGDRAAAVRLFLTDVFGAPRAFVFAMPFLMPTAWKRNKLVVHTAPYDLAILEDKSVLNERSSSIPVRTLVIGGQKSPKGLRDAVTAVANALPNGRSRFLSGQDHNISGPFWSRSSLSILVRARLPSRRNPNLTNRGRPFYNVLVYGGLPGPDSWLLRYPSRNMLAEPLKRATLPGLIVEFADNSSRTSRAAIWYTYPINDFAEVWRHWYSSLRSTLY